MIELPKDAEGREIPLDTVVLFSRSGEAHNIVRWIYTTDFETWTESNIWRAIDENHRAIDPELMYLTTPDSWEKLLDDLCEALEQGGRSGNPVCAYLAARGLCRGRMDEEGRCKLSDASFCANGMVSNIRGRIKRLCAGEDE